MQEGGEVAWGQVEGPLLVEDNVYAGEEAVKEVDGRQGRARVEEAVLQERVQQLGLDGPFHQRVEVREAQVGLVRGEAASEEAYQQEKVEPQLEELALPVQGGADLRDGLVKEGGLLLLTLLLLWTTLF